MSVSDDVNVMPLWCSELMTELKRSRALFNRIAVSDYYDDSTEPKRRDRTMWRFQAHGVDLAIKELRKSLKREYGRSP